MKRFLTTIVGAAAVLLVAVNIGAAAPVKAKPLPKPVFSVGTSTVSGNQVNLVYSGRVGKKTFLPSVRWTIVGETDASGAPLPVQLSSGVGKSVKGFIAGGYKLNLTVKLSTPKTNAHQAATTPLITVTALLGNYTAIGTQAPSIQPFNGSGDAYCDWQNAFGGQGAYSVSDGPPPRVSLPATFHCGPSTATGSCSNWQALPPSPPTDVVPASNRTSGIADGTVMTTGFNVYGGKVVCTSGYTAIPMLWVRFWYYDTNGPGWTKLLDSCELPLAGVTSFTVPPNWGGWVNFYASLLTFDPNKKLSNSNQYITDDPSNGRWLKGNIDPCKYGLPSINTAGINAG